MTIHPQEKTFKKIGVSLEHAFSQINEGLDVVEYLDQARDEREKDLYAQLAALHVHHSWHSIVKLFRRIAHEVDNGVPKGAQAGQQLIEQMLQRTSERPGILSMKHRDIAQKLSKFHKEFRNAKGDYHSPHEVTGLIEAMNDEIVPNILENVRLMALASPGGSKLIAHLQPKNTHSSGVHYEDLKRA